MYKRPGRALNVVNIYFVLIFGVGYFNCILAFGSKASRNPDGVLSVRARSEQKRVFYEPAKRLSRAGQGQFGYTPQTQYVDARAFSGLGGNSLHPDEYEVVPPTVVKKTLRNENGVLRYRPAGYMPRRSKSKNRRRKGGKRARPRTTTSSGRTTTLRTNSRKNRYKNRRTKKVRPAYRHNPRTTPRPEHTSRGVTRSGRFRHNKPPSTRPSKTTTSVQTAKIRRYKPSRMPHSEDISKTQVVTRAGESALLFTPTATRNPQGKRVNKFGESPNEVGLRRLYDQKSNPYGLHVPRGFRITTTSASGKDEPDVQTKARSPQPRSTKGSRTAPTVGKYHPTNPSVSVLQIQTSSIDEAHNVLKQIGTGFRVRLLPTAPVGDADLTTTEIDEFDVYKDQGVALGETAKNKTKSQLSTLQALFRKLSNATVVHPRRNVIDRRPRKPVSGQTNGSWWEGDHVCVTESPGLYGVSPTVFGRLAINTQCLENEDSYHCTESYGFGKNPPKKTTSYRCCPGFYKSVEYNTCLPVKHLREVDQNSPDVAGLSDESDFASEASYDRYQGITVFMPNDDVVNEYLIRSGFDNSDTNDVELFLENHVVAGKNLPSESLTNNQLLTAMSGNSIRVNFFNDSQLMTVNCRPVLQRDVVTGNSMVYVIGDVIQEVKGSTYDYVAQNHHLFSMFKSVIDSSGVASFLQSEDKPFTLFLPTNEAFEMSHEIPDSPVCLAKLVRNHLLDGVVCSASWNKTVMQSEAGEKLSLNKAPGGYFVNDVSTTKQDVMTTSGVIHIIEGLLQPGQAESVLTLIRKNPEYSEMLRYLDLGGMTDVLTSGENFTMIIPSNDAFKKCPSDVIAMLERKPTFLQQLLLFHTVPSIVEDAQLSAQASLSTLDPPHHLQVTSYYVRVAKKGSKKLNARKRVVALQCARAFGMSAKKACNGAVISVDRVLLPPAGSVLNALQRAPRGNFSILLRAISKAKLGHILTKSEEITVFAPTNAAFERIPARFVKFLFQNVRALQKILRFHITKGYHCCDQLAQGFLKLPTLQGANVASCPKKGRILLGRSKNRLRAKVVKCTLPGNNGLVHAIDNVLIPAGFRN